MAAVSPWVRQLMEDAGDDFCLCIPSLTHIQLSEYLGWCLDSGKDLPDKEVHRLLHPDTWHRLPEKSNNDLVKEEKNHNTNKMEEDDICEPVKDEVDSDHGEDFAQYSDWEDDTSLLNQ